jgi:L-fucose mutarotase
VLIGIDPLLRGELLAALDYMGHGDLLVVVDANFPGHAFGQQVIDLSGVSAPTAVRAISTVFPIDDVESAFLMENPDGRQLVQIELLDAAFPTGGAVVTDLDRFSFYERARTARLVVQTGERRPYGNIILHKGVVLIT